MNFQPVSSKPVDVFTRKTDEKQKEVELQDDNDNTENTDFLNDESPSSQLSNVPLGVDSILLKQKFIP